MPSSRGSRRRLPPSRLIPQSGGYRGEQVIHLSFYIHVDTKEHPRHIGYTPIPWFMSRIIIDSDDDKIDTNVDPRLLMLTRASHSGVHGGRTMFFMGTIIGNGFRLIDIGATHDVIDTNSARANGLAKRRITTIVFIGCGTELSY